jgi:hypothetical protein
LYPHKVSWEGDGIPNPDLAEISATDSDQNISDNEIIQRLFVPMYEEAIRCRDEGVIKDLVIADFASVHALGFPPEKEGIVSWGMKNK